MEQNKEGLNKGMTPEEKKVYNMDVCAMATATNANIVIKAGGKQIFAPLELLQAFEDKIGAGEVTMRTLIALCEETGEPNPNGNDGRVHFSLVARSMSKEEALNDQED